MTVVVRLRLDGDGLNGRGRAKVSSLTQFRYGTLHSTDGQRWAGWLANQKATNQLASLVPGRSASCRNITNVTTQSKPSTRGICSLRQLKGVDIDIQSLLIRQIGLAPRTDFARCKQFLLFCLEPQDIGHASRVIYFYS